MEQIRVPLKDDGARRAAIADISRSFLVEAGAGSGKTAVLAGRIVMLLAGGVHPRHVAAVTFTELAASELVMRIRAFVERLCQGDVPAELRVALPHGLDAAQRTSLAAAATSIDDMTCSTIHGFCQRLIGPYPVEADMDPGAVLVDPGQGGLIFDEITETWLRDVLSGHEDSLIATMAIEDPGGTLGEIREILHTLRAQPDLATPPLPDLHAVVADCMGALDAFMAFCRGEGQIEAETLALGAGFADLARSVRQLRDADTAACRIRLLRTPAPEGVRKGDGGWKTYRKKGKWKAAAAMAGESQAYGEQLNDRATMLYDACHETWQAVQSAVASHVFHDLVMQLRPVIDRFREHKRAVGLLDFDDLIRTARDLLRDHAQVRHALGQRFSHVLVDEFQDTDPTQTEIFWRLCGDPPSDAPDAPWAAWHIRPGALFLVGDPKQAIYRFRGADVGAYVQARDLFHTQHGTQGLLSITTNFRSCAPILDYVNDCFAHPLSARNGQPGFTSLDAFIAGRSAGACVIALDIPVAGGGDRGSVDAMRQAEARAVARMCAGLIGHETVRDRESGLPRPCRPGDIALLAPTGTGLHYYEEALEQLGIPVATQAGKGLFQRQEIQDLIALTRVLADAGDSLAFGALLRGPLVGLTDGELLDIVAAQPRGTDRPDRLPALRVTLDIAHVGHELARTVIEKLQVLRRRMHATTPYDLLAQAIDMLRVRPVLIERMGRQAERALANVDLFLTFAQAYDVRGLRAFADAMNTAWTDGARDAEGRPDAQEETVALYTVHAAKGLEWPIVMPLNTMSGTRSVKGMVIERGVGHIHAPLMGIPTTGYDAVCEEEAAEARREQIRLWYVALTRAREMLVLPRFDLPLSDRAWTSLLDLKITDLPSITLPEGNSHCVPQSDTVENLQTRERFVAEAETIVRATTRLIWKTPSRDEGATSPAMETPVPQIILPTADDGAGETYHPVSAPVVRGSSERGSILHKLLEEVLNHETPDTPDALKARAGTLLAEAGCPVVSDPAAGPEAGELAQSVLRALHAPEISRLRTVMVAEYPLYMVQGDAEATDVICGIADAVVPAADGTPEVIIDWKSDVNPSAATLAHYQAQVRAYMDMTGARQGLIVMATSGAVISLEAA
ncbi:ATP-dependent endonuclease [Novacetimonas maltaceti]|uniref:DNA 3'-5' helicase n=1 Tax=Novacetimonas maltaceti TaxID=1203393 RepID=A0A2S3W2D1_9PROT|nr:UvrD-helicase domain-containing protein [Novacetimonas maltaceti]POF63064.1 ATP-dependent DNA helicase UvrD1 [Novacetimonas maltaceti]PYD59992.1 ATP-dependent endonuclease [Novacetimonas maltaceti]